MDDHPHLQPQSPRWTSPITSCPRARQMRLRLSPMIAERRWPTCSGFATFGAAVVDDDFQRRFGADGVEALIGLGDQPFVGECEVQVPAGDVDGAERGMRSHPVADVARDLRRCLAQRLRGGECAVALHITQVGAAGNDDAAEGEVGAVVGECLSDDVGEFGEEDPVTRRRIVWRHPFIVIRDPSSVIRRGGRMTDDG